MVDFKVHAYSINLFVQHGVDLDVRISLRDCPDFTGYFSATLVGTDEGSHQEQSKAAEKEIGTNY